MEVGIFVSLGGIVFNMKKASGLQKVMKSKGDDNLRTPARAVELLLNHVSEDQMFWEPCCGGNHIVDIINNKSTVLGTDIADLEFPVDFLDKETRDRMIKTFGIEIIITNPPFSLKNKFIEACIDTKLPFALLLPTTALCTIARQKMFRDNGISILTLGGRTEFMNDKNGVWFETSWFTNGIFAPGTLNYEGIG